MACYIVLGGFHNDFQNNFILNGIKVRVFFGKNIKKKNTWAVMIKIIITFADQIFLCRKS